MKSSASIVQRGGRQAKTVMMDGKTYTVRELSLLYGLHECTIFNRINKGLTGKELVEPSQRRRVIEIDGVSKTVDRWAAETGISRRTIGNRLCDGVSGAALIAKPREAAAWSAAEDDAITAGRAAGKSSEEIAAELGRTPKAVANRSVHVRHKQAAGYHVSDGAPYEEDSECQRFVADHPGGASFTEIAAAMGLTRQRAEQICSSAMDKVRREVIRTNKELRHLAEDEPALDKGMARG